MYYNHRNRILSLCGSLLLVTLFSLSFSTLFWSTSTPAVAAPSSTILRVNGSVVGGAANGSSWTDAYPTLQQALAAATSGTEIWVAQGVYTPGNSVNDSFVLLNGVALYGGFDTADTARTDQDITNNLTVLSGDIDGDDTHTNGVVLTATDQVGNNNYHVVYASGVTSTAVLDGFTITAGRANGVPLDFNSADNNGGGIYNTNSWPTLNNLAISGNLALIKGGGIYNINSHPTLSNTVISGNLTDWYGGGMNNENNSSPILSQVVISNNASYWGGGLHNENGSSPTLTNVTISGNSADSFGGGLSNDANSNPTLNHVIITDNWSSNGGGIINFSSHPTLNNVVVSSNRANGGAGIYNDTGSISLLNVTISGNSANNTAGGMLNNNSTVSITNSIIWANDVNGDATAATSTFENRSSTLNLSHSLIANSGGSGIGWDAGFGTDNGNNLDADPQFVTPATPTTAGDLSLQATSPAIDAGNTLSFTSQVTATNPTDIAGNPRILNASIDMGAYEYPEFSPVTLTIGLTGTQTGVVTSDPAGINCGGTCMMTVTGKSIVTLTATADAGAAFTGWSGAVTRTNPVIAITMDMTQSITATFDIARYDLMVPITGTGTGIVTSDPMGIDCGMDCTEAFEHGTVVTLTATPDASSVFGGWSGTINSTDTTISTTIEMMQSITATFDILTYTLGVTTTGAGSGAVASDPTGIDCGTTCAETFAYGTIVTLTATADIGSTFAGWSGSVTSNDGTISVTVDTAKSITATFKLLTYTVDIPTSGAGSGVISSVPTGINCGITCTETFNYGTIITLTAVPDAGSAFSGWSGAVTSSDTTISVTIDMMQSITATFDLLTYTLTVSNTGTGAGTVTSDLGGINCGITCTETFTYGTMVALTATAGPNATFTGWSGPITSTDTTITVTIDMAQSVTATFTQTAFPIFLPMITTGAPPSSITAADTPNR